MCPQSPVAKYLDTKLNFASFTLHVISARTVFICNYIFINFLCQYTLLVHMLRKLRASSCKSIIFFLAHPQIITFTPTHPRRVWLHWIRTERGGRGSLTFVANCVTLITQKKKTRECYSKNCDAVLICQILSIHNQMIKYLIACCTYSSHSSPKLTASTHQHNLHTSSTVCTFFCTQIETQVVYIHQKTDTTNICTGRLTAFVGCDLFFMHVHMHACPQTYT